MSTKPLPYTPSKDDVKTIWVEAGAKSEVVAFKNHPPTKKELSAEFDRFIAKVKADALREFADELEANLTITSGSDDALTIGVLRERAEETEEEAR